MVALAQVADNGIRDDWKAIFERNGGEPPDLQGDQLFHVLSAKARYGLFVDMLVNFTRCFNNDQCSGVPVAKVSPLSDVLAFFWTPVAYAVESSGGMSGTYVKRSAGMSHDTYVMYEKLDKAVSIVADSREITTKNLDLFYLHKGTSPIADEHFHMMERVVYQEIKGDAAGIIRFPIYFPELNQVLNVQVDIPKQKLIAMSRSTIPDIHSPVLDGSLDLKASPPPEPPTPSSLLPAIKVPKPTPGLLGLERVAKAISKTTVNVGGQLLQFFPEDIAKFTVGRVQYLDGVVNGRVLLTVELKPEVIPGSLDGYYVRFITDFSKDPSGQVVDRTVILKSTPPRIVPALESPPKAPVVELPTSSASPEYKPYTEGWPQVNRFLTSIARFRARTLPVALLNYLGSRTKTQLVMSGAKATGEGLLLEIPIHATFLALNRAKERAYNAVYCTGDDIPEIPGGWRVRNCYLNDKDGQNLVVESDGSRVFVLENVVTSGKFILRDMPSLERVTIERLNPGDHRAALHENNPSVSDADTLPDPGVILSGVSADPQKPLSIEFYDNEWGTIPAFDALGISYEKPLTISFRNHALVTAAPIITMLKQLTFQKNLDIRIPGYPVDGGVGNPICDPGKGLGSDSVYVEREIMWDEIAKIDTTRVAAGLKPISSQFHCDAGPSWDKVRTSQK